MFLPRCNMDKKMLLQDNGNTQEVKEISIMNDLTKTKNDSWQLKLENPNNVIKKRNVPLRNCAATRHA